MSIRKLREVFDNIDTCDAWSLQLLQIKKSKRNGTTYCGREIILSPEGTLTNFLRELSEKYCSEEKGIENMYDSVIDYDGSTVNNVVYRLAVDNDLIANEYSALLEALGNPDSEVDPLQLSAQAYVLKGVVSIRDEELTVKLVSMQNPITTLKHKFMRANGIFKEISDKVISLRVAIDVVIVDNVVYMLTLAGENLFNMKRAYKSICEEKITDIIDCNIVNNADAFCSIASSKHNPRKFVSFNESHLQKLTDINCRKRFSEKFNIPLDGDNFDMNQPGAAEKLVKLLCDRGMVDPFDENPMEVPSSKKWE